MTFLLGEGTWLFTSALVVVLGIGVLELVALALGFSLSGSAEGSLGEAMEGGALAWLHVGRLPLLVVLVLLLTSFALVGYTLQGAIAALLGAKLPTLIAAPVALLGALPLARGSGAALLTLLPREESSAISAASFVGRSATLTAGEARPGRSAEARFQDEYGQTQYVMVEPDAGAAPLHAGERVLLVRELGPGRYHATPNPIAE